MIELVLKKLHKEKVQFDDLFFLAGDASNRKYFIIEQDNKKNVLMLDNDSLNLEKFIYYTINLRTLVTVPEILLNLKRTLKLAVAPTSLNTLLENVPVLSEASWNKPVDRVLLGVSYAWWF